MDSNTRVPPTEITGLLGAMMKRFSKKTFRRVPDALGVMWHNRPVLKASMSLSRKASRWNKCDKDLKAYAHMAVASLIVARSASTLGYFQARHEGLADADRGAATATLTVTDELSALPSACRPHAGQRLNQTLGAPAVGEVSGMVNLVDQEQVCGMV